MSRCTCGARRPSPVGGHTGASPQQLRPHVACHSTASTLGCSGPREHPPSRRSCGGFRSHPGSQATLLHGATYCIMLAKLLLSVRGQNRGRNPEPRGGARVREPVPTWHQGSRFSLKQTRCKLGAKGLSTCSCSAVVQPPGRSGDGQGGGHPCPHFVLCVAVTVRGQSTWRAAFSQMLEALHGQTDPFLSVHISLREGVEHQTPRPTRPHCLVPEPHLSQPTLVPQHGVAAAQPHAVRTAGPAVLVGSSLWSPVFILRTRC